ncbi:FtsX-like permease family protein [Cellulomonas timonensis]|uniref:FtsX-like permease family protein n=1 Tax=Cellulomonas timonensis TaxID=1689271 RepID=UPI0028FCA95F|nr:FtsX-like permease family protein [Cellulomonas timonensis]
MLWVDGPGAAAAIATAGFDKEPQLTVTTREQWLADARSGPLESRLLALLVASAAILAAFASVTLALTVVASAPERGRTVSALRTLGLDARLARRITLGELAPLTAAALLIGVGVGLAVPVALHSALGLSELTGELRPGPVTLDARSVVIAVGATVLALAVSVVVEAAVRRRERLGDVLRVGER